MDVLEKMESVGGGLAIVWLVEGDGGQRVVIDEAAGANEVFGRPVIDRAVVAELVDIAAQLVVNAGRVVEGHDASDMGAEKIGVAVGHVYLSSFALWR